MIATKQIRVQLVSKSDSHSDGTGRYTTSLCSALKESGAAAWIVRPSLPRFVSALDDVLGPLGFGFRPFFTTYPIDVEIDGADIWHLTSQTVASLLALNKIPSPVVVTILDVIPTLVRRRKCPGSSEGITERLFYNTAIRALSQADALIAISEYTKETLLSTVDVPPELVSVIYPPVDVEKFSLKSVSEHFRRTYAVPEGYRYLLYVGSEETRKNLPVVLRAVRTLTDSFPSLRLLKVGTPIPHERLRLLQLARSLGIVDRIRFFDFVSDSDLVHFYNLADLVVIPSICEGFGYPVAEAMSTGTPTICAHEGALPEVAGDAALYAHSKDPDSWAKEIRRILLDPSLGDDLAKKGQRRALRFEPTQCAQRMLALYEALT